MAHFAQHSYSRPETCPRGGKSSSDFVAHQREAVIGRGRELRRLPWRHHERVSQTTDGFLGYRRDARIGVAANQTSENIAAQLSAFRQVVGNGAEVATVAEFGAKVFASEVMLSNLGSLSFDRQFGPVTLKAMFGPAVLPGFEGSLNRSTQHLS